MTTRTVLLSCALVLSSGVASGPTPSAADEKPKVASVTADLSGRWVYNRELSDDAREKMREGMEKGGGRGRPAAGRPGRWRHGWTGRRGWAARRRRRADGSAARWDGRRRRPARGDARASWSRPRSSRSRRRRPRSRSRRSSARRGISTPTARSTRPTTAPPRSRPPGRRASSSSRRSGPAGAAWWRPGSACPTGAGSS